MNILKKTSAIALSLLFISSVFAMEQTAVVFDADDVVAIKGNVKKTVAGRVVWQNLFLLNTLVWLKEAMKHADAIGINGTTNAVAYASRKLEKEGTGSWASWVGPKLSQITQEFVEASVEPKAMVAMLEEVKKLKAKGIPVFIGTNQDLGQYRVWSRKMKDQGHDVNTLFDGALVVGLLDDKALDTLVGGHELLLHTLNNKKPEDVKFENEYFWVTNDNVYVTKSPVAVKPSSLYYKALKSMVNKKKPGARRIAFVDDKKVNTDGAEKEGLIAVQLKLAGGTADKTSDADIQKAVANMKNEFAAKGVSFDAE